MATYTHQSISKILAEMSGTGKIKALKILDLYVCKICKKNIIESDKRICEDCIDKSDVAKLLYEK